ncbi:MAG TPA: proton-conducting transporter membrane subunit [Dermatophilaceae bacterium]|nr:proton-conducting transporter membrane subunit [Dermatophilaceae bacterium]
MTPSLDLLALAPALAPALGAVAVLLLDAVLPGRRRLHVGIALVVLVVGAAGALTAALGEAPTRTLCLLGGAGQCLYVADGVVAILQLGALLGALATVLLLLGGRADDLTREDAGQGVAAAGDLRDPAVTVALVLAAAAGAAGVAAARELGTWLVMLELATLPVVALVALRGTRAAAHGALSFLTTVLLSFAVLVVGAGLWLVATGTPLLTGEAVSAAWAVPERRAVLVVAVVVLLVGAGFKLSLVPFHAWTPQAFTGGPLPVTTLLAGTSKVAAVAAALAVLAPLSAFARAPGASAVAAVLAALASVSALLGALVALRQDDVVRLLAWSTIGQAGWVVLPLAALSGSARRAATAYVLVYALATVVALAAVAAVRAGGPDGPDGPDGSRRLVAHTGLLRAQPLVGGPLALALLVLAGLPPGIIGLVAKVLVLRPLVDAGRWPLALVGVVAAVLGVAVYVRWVAVLLGAPRGAPAQVRVGGGTAVVLGVGTVLLVLTSVAPQLLLGLLGEGT